MAKITIDAEWCKGCLLCLAVCPAGVWQKTDRRNAKGYLTPYPARAEECVACRACELTCPDLAITVEENEHAA